MVERGGKREGEMDERKSQSKEAGTGAWRRRRLASQAARIWVRVRRVSSTGSPRGTVRLAVM